MIANQPPWRTSMGKTRCGGVDDSGRGGVGMGARNAEANSRPGIAERNQSIRDSRIRASASDRQSSRASHLDRSDNGSIATKPGPNKPARGSTIWLAARYMLQQGHFAADVIYFYGEDSNLTAIFDDKAPDMPAGYGFDYINADGLIHELNVTDGRITTKSGMNYACSYSIRTANTCHCQCCAHSQAGGDRAPLLPARSRRMTPAWLTMQPNSRS